jgi:serine/threonine-protein kinase
MARLRVTGGPIQIADRVKSVFNLQFVTSAFSAVGSALVYLPGSAGGLTQLTWFDRKGGRGAVIGEPADYSNPALSADGRMLAAGKRDPVSGNRDIWIFDLVRGTSTPLTFDPSDDFNPLWSPDGQKIIFVSNRKGHRDLYWKASSGAGSEEVLLESDQQKSSEDWTRDGQYVIYNQTGNKPREIWALPLSAVRKPFLVISGAGNVEEGHVSPNGKWISYTSSESGTPEIYVQDFPPTGGKWQVSFGGGVESSWNANGKELFYLQGNRLMAVDVNTESGSFANRGTPRMLFDAPIANPLRNAYLATTDGQKFLINTRIETKDTLPMTLVLNWPAALKH